MTSCEAKSCLISCHLNFSIPAALSILLQPVSQLSITVPDLGDGKISSLSPRLVCSFHASSVFVKAWFIGMCINLLFFSAEWDSLCCRQGNPRSYWACRRHNAGRFADAGKKHFSSRIKNRLPPWKKGAKNWCLTSNYWVKLKWFRGSICIRVVGWGKGHNILSPSSFLVQGRCNRNKKGLRRFT